MNGPIYQSGTPKFPLKICVTLGPDSQNHVKLYVAKTVVLPEILQELKGRIAALSAWNAISDFHFYWIDAEGDRITVYHDGDFKVFLSEVVLGSLPSGKLYVQPIKMVRESVPAVTTMSVDQSAPVAGNSEPDAGLPIHVGVLCDGCDGEIRGNRFKCMECPDYDLCARCESRAVHPEHVMARITKAESIFSPLQFPERCSPAMLYSSFKSKRDEKHHRRAEAKQAKYAERVLKWEQKQAEMMAKYDEYKQRKERQKADENRCGGKYKRKEYAQACNRPRHSLDEMIKSMMYYPQGENVPVADHEMAAEQPATRLPSDPYDLYEFRRHLAMRQRAESNTKLKTCIDETLSLASNVVANTCANLFNFLDPLNATGATGPESPPSGSKPNTPTEPSTATKSTSAAGAVPKPSTSAYEQPTVSVNTTPMDIDVPNMQPSTSVASASNPTATDNGNQAGNPKTTAEAVKAPSIVDLLDDDSDVSIDESHSHTDDEKIHPQSKWVFIEEDITIPADAATIPNQTEKGTQSAQSGFDMEVLSARLEAMNAALNAAEAQANLSGAQRSQEPTVAAPTPTPAAASANAASPTNIYPQLGTVLQNIVYHPDSKIDRAVKQMMEMGFSNRDGFITKLMCDTKGDITAALDLLQSQYRASM